MLERVSPFHLPVQPRQRLQYGQGQGSPTRHPLHVMRAKILQRDTHAYMHTFLRAWHSYMRMYTGYIQGYTYAHVHACVPDACMRVDACIPSTECISPNHHASHHIHGCMCRGDDVDEHAAEAALVRLANSVPVLHLMRFVIYFVCTSAISDRFVSRTPKVTASTLTAQQPTPHTSHTLARNYVLRSRQFRLSLYN